MASVSWKNLFLVLKEKCFMLNNYPGSIDGAEKVALYVVVKVPAALDILVWFICLIEFSKSKKVYYFCYDIFIKN